MRRSSGDSNVAPVPGRRRQNDARSATVPRQTMGSGNQREDCMKKSILALALLAGFSANAFAAGNRPAIGVAEFKNESAAGWWRGGVGWELAGMLSNELSSSGDFRVVERSKLEKVLEEQNLAASGRVRSGTGAKMGQVTGSDYLVFGTVTS
jgi:curli biogenesis system outer membrane secretion channel CsgG